MSLSNVSNPVLQENAALALAALSGDQSTQEKILKSPGLLDKLVMSVYQDQNSGLAEQAARAIANLTTAEDSTFLVTIAAVPKLLESLVLSLRKGENPALQKHAAFALQKYAAFASAELRWGDQLNKERILNFSELLDILVKWVDEDQNFPLASSQSAHRKDTIRDEVGSFFESDEFYSLMHFLLHEGDRKLQVLIARLLPNLARAEDDAIQYRLLHFCGDMLASCFVQKEVRELQMEAARVFANLTDMEDLDRMVRKGITRAPIMLKALAKVSRCDQMGRIQLQGRGGIRSSAPMEDDKNAANIFQDEICYLQVEAARVLINWAISEDDSFEGIIFCVPGMLVWAGVGSTTPSSEPGSEYQLRTDIQSLGLATWEEKFNPQQMCALYDVRTDQNGIDFMFFHAEAMAALFGVGLRYAIVHVSLIHNPDLKIVIEETGCERWKDGWLASHTGSFKPMIFQRLKEEPFCLGNQDNSHRSDSQHFPTSDNFNHENADPSIRFGFFYKRWIEGVVQCLQKGHGTRNGEPGANKNEDDGGSKCNQQGPGNGNNLSDDARNTQNGDADNDQDVNNGNSDHGGDTSDAQGGGGGGAYSGGNGDASSGGSGDTSSGGSEDAHSGGGGGAPGGGSGAAHGGGSGDSHGGGNGAAHGGGSGDGHGGGSEDAHDGGGNGNGGSGDPSKASKDQSSGKVEVVVQLLQKSAFYDSYDYQGFGKEVGDGAHYEGFDLICERSQIVPTLKIKFLYDEEFQKRVDVFVEVQYNMAKANPKEKFKWYQNDLQISFSCQADVSRQLVRKVDDNIASETRTIELKNSEKSSESTSTSTSRGTSGRFAVNLPPTRLAVQQEMRNSLGRITEHGMDNTRVNYYQCLTHPPTFQVKPTNGANDLSHCASYLYPIQPAFLWDESAIVTSTGLLANLKLAVSGAWHLRIDDGDTNQLPFKTEAVKMLSRCSNPAESSDVKDVKPKRKSQGARTRGCSIFPQRRARSSAQVQIGPSVHNRVWQGLTRELILDHDFEKFFGQLESSSEYQIKDPLNGGAIDIVSEAFKELKRRKRSRNMGRW